MAATLEEAGKKIIVALDTKDPVKALELVRALKSLVGGFKLGLEFFTSVFVQVVTMGEEDDSVWANQYMAALRALFYELTGLLFWDGKWNDIPNTVAGAALGVVPLNPKFINVHASCGKEAMKKVVANKGNSIVLAVTVLTSLDDDDCRHVFGDLSAKKVFLLAQDAQEAGCGGIISSPQDLKILREYEINGHGASIPKLKVTPGVRPLWAAANDQKRVMTPGEAIQAGAGYLVIGRPITKPPAAIGTPVDAAKKIAEEIAAALQ
ncbi:MAG: orotidine-5'-phosphate decarboxylase [bacterium]|nr:orotidine-5'-phosphate decarboxylase [bacterium]